MVRQTKKAMIAILGSLVLLAGLAMIFLPGPAFLIIPAGLAILATEFEFAHRWMCKVKGMIRRRTGHSS